MYDKRFRPAALEHLHGVTIRLAHPEEWDAIGRLAQLDSSPPPPREPLLVGEVDGELRAAVSVRRDYSIANPFRRTLEIVELLHARAAQLRSARAFSARPRPGVAPRGPLTSPPRP